MVSFKGSITVICPNVKDQNKLESALRKVDPNIKKQIQQSDVNIKFSCTDGPAGAYAETDGGIGTLCFEQDIVQTKNGFVKDVLETVKKLLDRRYSKS